MTQFPAGDWLSVREVAKLTGLSKGRISQLISMGEIPASRLDGVPYVRREDAEKFRDTPRPKRGPKPKQ